MTKLWAMRVKASREKDYWQLQQFAACLCPDCDADGHWTVIRGSSSAYDRDEMKREMERHNA